MNEPLSDERLMLAYRDGDATAFERLYARYRTRLFRYLAHQTGDSRLAEELYQDVWMRVIAARAGYEPLAKFSTWLFRIAHNRLLDHFRKNARDASPAAGTETDCDDLPAGDEANPATVAERRGIAVRLSAALAALPPEQREAFLMAEEGGLTLDEIAAATATGRETVKSRLRYAVGKLRTALQDLL